MSRLFDFDRLDAEEAALHLRAALAPTPAPKPVAAAVDVQSYNVDVEEDVNVDIEEDVEEDWALPHHTLCHRSWTSFSRRDGQVRGRGRVRRAEPKPRAARQTRPLDRWCSFTAALVRRAAGLGMGQRGRRLRRANRSLGEESEALPKRERCQRSPFSLDFEEHGCVARCWQHMSRKKSSPSNELSDKELQNRCIPALIEAKETVGQRWNHIVGSMLQRERTIVDPSALRLKHSLARRVAPSPLQIRRWVHLHGTPLVKELIDQQRTLLLHESPPYELTLLYQHQRKTILQQNQHEKRLQRRWCRLILQAHAQHYHKLRKSALDSLVDLRSEARASASSSGLASGAQNISPNLDYSVAAMAAQVGLDVETYNMLLELEEREIEPEDYDLLGRLDESVKMTTLTIEQVSHFPTEVYHQQEMVEQQESCTASFGLDFWRLPHISVEEEDAHESGHQAFDFDFWKLPLATSAESIDSGDSTTVDGASSSGCTFAGTCGVCLVDFDDGDEMRLLPCGHRFHKDCIDHWLLQSSTVCPVDKRDLRQEA